MAVVERDTRSLEDVWREIEGLRTEMNRLRVGFNLSPRLMAGEFTSPNVNGTDEIITDLDFAPRVGWFMVAPNSANDAIHQGWGFGADTVDGVLQFSMAIRGTETGPTMARNRNNSDAISICDTFGNNLLRGQITSFDGAGITINFILASNLFDVYWMLMG